MAETHICEPPGVPPNMTARFICGLCGNIWIAFRVQDAKHIPKNIKKRLSKDSLGWCKEKRTTT